VAQSLSAYENAPEWAFSKRKGLKKENKTENGNIADSKKKMK
jgi:hypothetical protein